MCEILHMHPKHKLHATHQVAKKLNLFNPTGVCPSETTLITERKRQIPGTPGIPDAVVPESRPSSIGSSSTDFPTIRSTPAPNKASQRLISTPPIHPYGSPERFLVKDEVQDEIPDKSPEYLMMSPESEEEVALRSCSPAGERDPSSTHRTFLQQRGEDFPAWIRKGTYGNIKSL